MQAEDEEQPFMFHRIPILFSDILRGMTKRQMIEARRILGCAIRGNKGTVHDVEDFYLYYKETEGADGKVLKLLLESFEKYLMIEEVIVAGKAGKIAGVGKVTIQHLEGLVDKLVNNGSYVRNMPYTLSEEPSLALSEPKSEENSNYHPHEVVEPENPPI